MKKQLLTVGDSFTYGDELADIYDAWPYRLADDIDYEVNNLGQSGCSNVSILRRTLEDLAQYSYDLVVVGWTGPGRIEWKDGTGAPYDVWPGRISADEFFKNHPWRLNLLDYISQYHSPEYLYQQYLIQVISLQSYCSARNIPLLMMNIRHNDYYRAVGHEQHAKLAEQINTEQFIGWNEFGMTEIAGDHLMPNKHPNKIGHRKIADEIKKHIRS